MELIQSNSKAAFGCFVRSGVCLTLGCFLAFAAGCVGDDDTRGSVASLETESLPAANSLLKTAVVGVHVGRDNQLAIVFASKKNYPFAAERQQGNLRIEAKDNRSAALIGSGTAKLPELCDCPINETHFEGDVRRAHEATILVKVPYTSGAETLTLTAQRSDDDAPITLKANLAEVAR